MTSRERLADLEVFGIKLGLEAMAVLLEQLGNPHSHFRIIHIAGTNGKGSVAAMTERALRAAGYRTGRYSSPHLVHIEERVAIDGEPIASALFDQAADRVVHAMAALPHPPSFFEATTALAFEAFRTAGIDVGIVEVGLGGRLDATNIVSPVATAITSIALDHEGHLGTTLAAIAGEKAGIIKPGIPVVIGHLPPEALEVIVDVAATVGAPVVPVTETMTRMVPSEHDGCARVAFDLGTSAIGPCKLALLGTHQIENAATTVLLLDTARSHGGLSLTDAHIETGLTEAHWPGRLEWVDSRFGRLLLDGAHNPAGARALAAYLAQRGGPPMPLVMAVMEDKAVDGMLESLLPVVGPIHVTSTGGRRSLSPERLADGIRRLAPEHFVQCHTTIRDALAAASAHDAPILVAGSLFLVGAVKALLS